MDIFWHVLKAVNLMIIIFFLFLSATDEKNVSSPLAQVGKLRGNDANQTANTSDSNPDSGSLSSGIINTYFFLFSALVFE